MATPSQRRKEKHKRKRQEKKDQMRKRHEAIRRALTVHMPEISTGSHARHRQRLAAQSPQAWPGETPEDVAVFDDSTLKTLSPDLAGQAAAIRDALKLACASRGDDALKGTASIPRSSPYSEWRLFVRGLVSWLAGDTSSASEAWQRLNPDRRPGRIATAMMNSLSADLEQAKITQASNQANPASPTAWSDRLDGTLLYHAKLLRRVCFDRAAIRLAQAGLSTPEEVKDALIGPRKTLWLQKFASEYRQSEPEFVAALEQVALRRAFAQNYVDVFTEATKAFEGPPHDRRSLLLSYLYFTQFASTRTKEDEAEAYLVRYLKDDLPKNQALSAPLRGALASQIHLAEAGCLIKPKVSGIMAIIFDEMEDIAEIHRHLNASIKAYPTNRSAHTRYAEWIESKLDDDGLTQKTRESILKDLALVMQTWSQSLPEDIKPRLWLIDYLLENERIEEAKPHVDWLAASRHDDPRVRAAPWKWQLLEAMRLCRRKNWLSLVPAQVDEAEKLWPAWLSKAWLPYLRAAVALRSGKQEEFEARRERIWQASEGIRDSLTDACMMLGAAQLMRVPAGDLKPLRAPVDGAVKALDKVSEKDLLRVCSFFWDLHRTQLLYPAYRMHGKKIADATLVRLRNDSSIVLNHLDDGEVHAAVLLCAELRCFQRQYELKLPSWFSVPAVQKHPMFAAAKLRAFLKTTYQRGPAAYKDLATLLREAAKSERDAYYRYWFVALADEFEEVRAQSAASRFGFDAFSEVFRGAAQYEDEDDDDDDDDEDDYEYDDDDDE